MVFAGILAAVFYTLVLGALWPSRDGAGLAEHLLATIGKSLYLSWLVVAVSYWLNLSSLLIPLVVLVSAALAWQWRSGRHRIVVERPTWNAVALVAVIAVCVHLFFGGFGSDYRLIFMTWDALESWHRWGLELTRNEYHPYNSAYPILFPGLFSLVYKAQGDAAIWIFAKLTLFVVPVILCLLIALLTSHRLYVSAALLGAFILQFFFLSNAWPMLMGNMDIPISAMMLASGVLMYIAAQRFSENENDEAHNFALLAAIFVGLTSMTKQQGIVMMAPLALLVGFGVLRRRFTWWSGLVVLVVASVPLATYLPIFLSIESNPFGILPYLASDALRSSPHGNPTVTAFHYVRDMVPLPAWLVIGGLAFANLTDLRRLSGVLGLLFLVLGIAAFFFYGKCCAYEARNGWWVLILLVTSALFALARVEAALHRPSDPASARAFPAVRLSTAALATAAGAALLTSIVFKDADAYAAQERLQWVVAGRQMGPLIRENLKLFAPGDRLVSQVGPARWLPTMQERFSLCRRQDVPCMEKARAAANRIFVLIQPGNLEFPHLRQYLTPANLIGDADSMQLYGPIDRAGNNATASAPSMFASAAQGARLRLIFDQDTCGKFDLGALQCGIPYEARYDSETNSWTVKGPDKDSGTEVLDAYDNAPRRPGHISAWAWISVFDRWGTLYFDGSKIGTLTTIEPTLPTAERPRSVLDLAERGVPLRLALDRTACGRFDLGEIQCEVPYEARYDSDRQLDRG